LGIEMRDLSCKNGLGSGYSTLDEWISAEEIPFAIESPMALNHAIDEALAKIGGLVRLLGLGEALHGSSYLLLLSNRLFSRLVENMDLAP